MPKISVLTPSVRPDGLGLVQRALRRQTFTDFEWLVGFKEGLFIPVDREIGHDEPSFKFVSDDFIGGFWTLNRIYNKLIRESKGNLIVSWQDYTYARPDALEKFWAHFQTNPKGVVSGVGDKYRDENWTASIWQDPRRRLDQGSFYPCYFNDIEFNFCAVPKEAFYAVGGFDEDLDFLGFGMDGYSIMDRLNILGGWDFYLDQTNNSFSLTHDRPKGWEANNLLHGKYQEHCKNYQGRPLDFLKKGGTINGIKVEP